MVDAKTIKVWWINAMKPLKYMRLVEISVIVTNADSERLSALALACLKNGSFNAVASR